MWDKEKQREYYRRKHEEAKPAYAALMKYYPLTLDNLDGEVWKDIADFDGDYQISNFGRVKSFKKGKTSILKPQLRGEYLNVDLYIDGKQKHQQIHILVARAFIPNPDNKPEVNHKIGMKFNCHVENLEWATQSENNQHAVKNGLSPSGEDNYQAGVTSEQAAYIRDNPDNLSCKELGEMFGVKKQAISKIQLGKSYQNASGTIRESKVKHVADEIRERIRADWATGQYSKAALARKFGCDRKTIRRIIREG